MGRITPKSDGTAKGTSGADTIIGSSLSNVFAGMGGSDSLRGGGGVDLIDGGSGNDRIYGDSGNDALAGGLGRDTLYGGSGSDFFAFDVKPTNSTADTIADFSVKYDTIILDKSIFKVAATSEGIMSSGAFWRGSKAHDADDRIIYDKSAGVLYYDPDGTGAKAAIQFAKLSKNLALTYKDFLIF
ncbi:hypothetical protein BB934_23150 [Microvirga ossetica]|uniref:Peptidase M10 serralysin C-terminal domain-containing protein n=1 Tax=Microvirga ossetica TaxID=1882682 RepID=A0A1B2ELA5_9HYPH|nr:calcium-binding protein [Microvirga ossetica]ANY80768.1 hypothetical protein BB934_23150 [Microvirga ossetica]